MSFELHHSDCVTALREMPADSVDSVVTDPPYGLSFLGNHWDRDVPGVEVWGECLRVLKPGGHLLAFAGTRTQHRMATHIEAAGFEVRDVIAWVYSGGFPKSRDVSEAMARHLAGERPPQAGPALVRPGVYEVTAFLREARNKAGWTNRQIDALFGTNGMAGHWTTAGSQPAVPSVRQWEILKGALGFGDELDALVAELAATERPEDWGTGERNGEFLAGLDRDRGAKPAGGWGTALKPALEPITVARKPPAGSVTANVLTHGTGALNIGGCRFSDADRWPTNLVHDGSADVIGVLGASARFFYCGKASKKDRDEGNTHPTVKPTELMAYLCRMVTPPGGVVLDPFMGSGSTGKAAVREGFRFIGIDMAAEYVEIARQRLTAANDNFFQQDAVA